MKTLQLLFVFFLLPLVLRGEEELIWQQEFAFTQLPSELSKEWIQRGPPGTSRIEGGHLVIEPGDEPYVGWIVNSIHGKKLSAIWHGETPTTVEFRLRVRDRRNDPSLAGAVSIALLDGHKIYRFSFKNKEMLTYRIVLENGVAHRYIIDRPDVPATTTDGKESEWKSRGGITSNALVIGKFNHNIDGTSEWEFIRWTNAGAYHP